MSKCNPLTTGLWLGVCAITLGAGLATPARASSVESMTLATLADYAGQVIVGDVAAVRSYWADDPRRIESEITLTGVEYLKGQPRAATDAFTLVVPGGTVGEWTMRIADAPVLAAGERWVLFLLPEYKTFPTVGLSQGAFRVRPDEHGTPRVFDAAAQAVTGVDAAGFVQVARQGRSAGDSQLVAANHTRVTLNAAAQGGTALSYEEFVAQLRPILAQSRVYELTGPAGRRVAVQYRAVRLRTAATAPKTAPEGDTPALRQAPADGATPQPGAAATDRPVQHRPVEGRNLR